MMTSLPSGMNESLEQEVSGEWAYVSVAQVCVDVDLLLDPGGEVRDVAVNPGSEHFAEAHAAPRRQAEQRPATAALLTHQWAAAVTLNTRTHVKHTHTEKLCGLGTSCWTLH